MVEKDGAKIPLDDPENLQTLCARCNREKQDRRSVDFHPSADRLRESLILIAERSEAEHPSALMRPKTSG
ncbi:MAG: HNH endonuclease [Actinomycetia bacterium]|nr:HNH endonuclease [Actinomycetes bacterium]